ncbi:hypothetical protein PCCS19_42700 [Paenibacillus sp. CCS19]|uniref:hypothetical protein n=1 Tax=Paenibacillus sp. CCS19 TaxID=3158387 RepID=UPI00256824FD|nr:hypothetical protein [Paenibacillus cellulosilyticus]GMK41214.1 hypothetical protein PCCS19_42700 [Paenibacillus cellulosilyticus]
MTNHHINELYETLTPTDEQKNRMWNAMEQQLGTSEGTAVVRVQPKRVPRYRKLVMSISASVLVLLLAATAYAAIVGNHEKQYQEVFNGKGTTVYFANGTSMHYVTDGKSKHAKGAMGGDEKGPWVVKESWWGRLTVNVDGKKINITKQLKEKGYFYYTYRDNVNVLHRLYIVKNAGGKKDYSERWYSQMEWLPEVGVGGAFRGLSGPLSDAIVWAEIDAEEDGKDLEAALQDRLSKYWSEYGE